MNEHVLEDLEDYILLQGFDKMSVPDQAAMIEENLLERRQREHMLSMEAEKDTAKEEGKEANVNDPIKEGSGEDKKRTFMQPLRPHNNIWNFKIEEDTEKVDHVMRVGADPRQCYIDGRVEALLDCIERVAIHLKIHNE